MMEKIMVSAACGVMNSLLRKLATLLEKEYMLLKDVKHNIIFLRDELTSMNLLLFKLADIEDLDVQVKEWRNKVRELAYDIEDCIDNFMVNDRPNSSLVRKTVGKIKKLWFRHDIGKQIQELKTRVVEESARRYRYKLDDSTFRTAVVEIDHRLKALYVETNKLEGIDSPVEQIIQWLTGNGKQDQELNIMTIVGFGGLGKTTLAMQVYNKFKDKFVCTAFVSVSRGPNIKKVLMDLLKDVGAAIDTTDDEMRLINKLKGHLMKKRKQCSQLIRGWLCDHGHMNSCYAALSRSPLQNFTDSAKGFPSANESKEPFPFSGFEMTHGFVVSKALFARKECLSRLTSM